MLRSKKKTLKEGFIELSSKLFVDKLHLERLINNIEYYEGTNPYKNAFFKFCKYITDVKTIIDDELGQYKDAVHDFFSKLFLGK